MKAALILIVCVASAFLANAVPVPVVRGKVVLPFPVIGCTATNLQPGETPVVDCEPADPFSDENVLSAGRSFDVPTGAFGRCEIGVDDEGEIQIGCVGIPVSASVEPVIEDGVLSLPTTAKSCVLTNIHSCPNGVVLVPEVECTPAGPGEGGFRAGETFDFSGGNFGRCVIDADGEGAPLVQCVGVPVAGVSPAKINRNGSIELPAGAASCTATYTNRRQPPEVFCTVPVFGCRQSEFKAGVVVLGLRGTSGLKCTYVAESDGTAGPPSCSTTGRDA